MCQYSEAILKKHTRSVEYNANGKIHRCGVQKLAVHGPGDYKSGHHVNRVAVGMQNQLLGVGISGTEVAEFINTNNCEIAFQVTLQLHALTPKRPNGR